jgi:hypothetical protein
MPLLKQSLERGGGKEVAAKRTTKAAAKPAARPRGKTRMA